MPECKEIFETLSMYLDREMSPETLEAIEAHVSDCKPCVEFVASLRRSIELCRKHEPVELPGPLDSEARDRLRAAYDAYRANRGG
jgi:anti-sigma factor RsiW